MNGRRRSLRPAVALRLQDNGAEPMNGRRRSLRPAVALRLQDNGTGPMNGKRWLLLAAVALVLTACAAGPNTVPPVVGAAGFWQGLWHGLIYPVTFIISLFTDSVSIYEVRNNGNWYDFGFVAGIGLLHTIFGSHRHVTNRRRK